MKFTDGGTHATLYRSVRVTDGPALRSQRADRKLFRVEKVSILYTLNRGTGIWAVSNPSDVVLYGHVLRADGNFGVLYHHRHPHYTINDDSTTTWGVDYEWVQILVDALRPVGTVGLPVFVEELS